MAEERVLRVTRNNQDWVSQQTGIPVLLVRDKYERDRAAGRDCVLKGRPMREISSVDSYQLSDHPRGHTAFISVDGNVINMGGENYYRSCGAPVRELTSCVKRVGHRAKHEDYYGEEAD